jgi:HNH endonuclease
LFLVSTVGKGSGVKLCFEGISGRDQGSNFVSGFHSEGIWGQTLFLVSTVGKGSGVGRDLGSEGIWGRKGSGVKLLGGRPAEEYLYIHHRIWRSRGGPDTADNLELLHANCHRQIQVQERLTKAAASCKGRP